MCYSIYDIPSSSTCSCRSTFHRLSSLCFPSTLLRLPRTQPIGLSGCAGLESFLFRWSSLFSTCREWRTNIIIGPTNKITGPSTFALDHLSEFWQILFKLFWVGTRRGILVDVTNSCLPRFSDCLPDIILFRRGSGVLLLAPAFFFLLWVDVLGRRRPGAGCYIRAWSWLARIFSFQRMARTG